MHRAAETVHLILEIGGKGGEPQVFRSNLDSQSLPFIRVVAQRNAGETHRAPVPIHLAIKKAPVLELGTDVRVDDPPGELQVRSASPVWIVDQPGLGHGASGQNEVAKRGPAAQLRVWPYPFGSSRM